MRRNLAIAGLLVLSGMALEGCAEFGARGLTALTYAADEARDYVQENNKVREWIRQECFDRLKTRLKKLDVEEKFEEGDALLISSYPGLVTVSVLRAAAEEGIKSILSEPFGCIKPEQPQN